MFLNDRELKELQKLGFTVGDDGHIGQITKKAGVSDLVYCGFSTYVDKEGKVYYENDAREIVADWEDDPVIQAEQRFVHRHLDKK